MELRGEAAIVTGGASGLGRATAIALKARGANVAIFDVNADSAARVADEIGGYSAACDVGDETAAEAAIAAAAGAVGPARVLVNCAGIAPAKRVLGREGPHPLGDFEDVVRVNLVGAFNMIRLAAARMAKLEPTASGDRGVIVSTASVAAFEGQVGQAAYSASKAGIVGMTLPIAREFAPIAIRVNAIAPGVFGTPMLSALPREAQGSLERSVPYPARLGDPKEFAALVVHIVENGYLNGETIRIDGALRMAPR